MSNLSITTKLFTAILVTIVCFASILLDYVKLFLTWVYMNIEVFIFNVEQHDNSYFEKFKQPFLEK